MPRLLEKALEDQAKLINDFDFDQFDKQVIGVDEVEEVLGQGL